MRSKSGKRDTNDIANDPLLALTAPVVSRPLLTPIQQYYEDTAARFLQNEALTAIEDHRTWHPDPVRPLLTPAGRRSTTRLRDPMSRLRRFPAQTKAILVASDPRTPISSAIVCARRRVRKEVMHALKLTKRRGKGGGKPHRNWRSYVKC